jgi:putative transposase
MAAGGLVYHVLNRANAGITLFKTGLDYAAFMEVLREAHGQTPMRTLAWCLMSNHWHFVLWPFEDGDLSDFMYWLTMTHTKRWHAAHGTNGRGHLYQARFRGFPTESDDHYLTVMRYVERNALKAGLVDRAEDWRWGSLWARQHGDSAEKALLQEGPRPLPEGWIKMVNTAPSDAEEKALRTCINRDRPYGSDDWVDRTAWRLNLQSTLRPLGRPRKR